MWVNTSYVHIGVNVLIFLLVNVLLLSLAVAAYISWKSKTFFNARNLKSGWFSARGVPEYDGPERRLIGKSIHLLHYTKEIYSKQVQINTNTRASLTDGIVLEDVRGATLSGRETRGWWDSRATWAAFRA